MAICNIALTFGYVESAKVSPLIFGAEIPCKTKKEAFHSLVEYLYEKYKSDYRSYLDKINGAKDCCKAYIDKEAFCPKCGTNLKTITNFDWDHFEDYLRHIHGTDLDGYGDHDEVSQHNPNGWAPWNWKPATAKSWFIIDENAEWMIEIALVELHPELKNDVFLDNCNYGIELMQSDYNELFK